MAYKKLVLTLIFLNFFAVNAAIVSCSGDVCTWEDFAQSIRNLITTIVEIAFYFAVFLALAGAFLIMFGGPRPNWYRRGKQMIYIAIVGYILVLSTGIIFDLILEFFQPKLKQTFLTPSFENIFIQKNFVFAQQKQEWEKGLENILTGENVRKKLSESQKKDQTQQPTQTQQKQTQQKQEQTKTETSKIDVGVFYNPLRDALNSALKCGKNAKPIFGSKTLGKVFACLFDAIKLLEKIAFILAVFAIIVSAGYLIFTPVFGTEKAALARKILVWSLIGLIIVLTAEIIKNQILRVLKP